LFYSVKPDRKGDGILGRGKSIHQGQRHGVLDPAGLRGQNEIMRRPMLSNVVPLATCGYLNLKLHKINILFFSLTSHLSGA
jgi:hypothetical protein